jgi:N-formylglutamate amidohydrolase
MHADSSLAAVTPNSRQPDLPAPNLPAIAIERPERQTIPFVFASPHSGREYPAEFLAASQLDLLTLRRTEDSFVDEIFRGAPARGSYLLKALFARSYCDPNREAYELDPVMFEDPLPAFANTASLRVKNGLGLIARYAATGDEIYSRKLRFHEAQARIEQCWRPYHRALADLIHETRQLFGAAVVIDCHSMPSVGRPCDRDHGRSRADIVLGDCHGKSCSPALTDLVETVFREMGLRVVRNHPYAGGHTTAFYGRPNDGVHALQIEINRALYMNENRMERKSSLLMLSRQVGDAIVRFSAFNPAA